LPHCRSPPSAWTALRNPLYRKLSEKASLPLVAVGSRIVLTPVAVYLALEERTRTE